MRRSTVSMKVDKYVYRERNQRSDAETDNRKGHRMTDDRERKGRVAGEQLTASKLRFSAQFKHNNKPQPTTNPEPRDMQLRPLIGSGLSHLVLVIWLVFSPAIAWVCSREQRTRTASVQQAPRCPNNQEYQCELSQSTRHCIASSLDSWRCSAELLDVTPG